jgi:hypothetical protein
MASLAKRIYGINKFNNWNIDLTCDTIYIQWFVIFFNLYLDLVYDWFYIRQAYLVALIGSMKFYNKMMMMMIKWILK